MLCASCGATLDGDGSGQDHCDGPELLADRYRLLEVMGVGASGRTYRALDEQDGVEVAVKELLFREAGDVKSLELFEREGRILRRLRHQGIAPLLDAFSWGKGRGAGLYLVRELVLGESLTDEMARRRFTGAEALAVMAELLETLEHLHGCIPPVLHRDIKPSNVLRRAANQKLLLIDFGASAELSEEGLGRGSTIAGTFGYMAPERFAGRSGRGTDTYSVGVLGLVLMTALPPEELVGETQRLAWRRRTRMPWRLNRLFRQLLEPDESRRTFDAGALARRCRQLASEIEDSGGPVVLPEGRRSPPWLVPALAAVVCIGLVGTIGAASVSLLASRSTR